jgi:hypothetical protein
VRGVGCGCGAVLALAALCCSTSVRYRGPRAAAARKGARWQGWSRGQEGGGGGAGRGAAWPAAARRRQEGAAPRRSTHALAAPARLPPHLRSTSMALLKFWWRSSISAHSHHTLARSSAYLKDTCKGGARRARQLQRQPRCPCTHPAACTSGHRRTRPDPSSSSSSSSGGGGGSGGRARGGSARGGSAPPGWPCQR